MAQRVNNQEQEWLMKDQKKYLSCPKCKKGDLDTRIPRPLAVKRLLGWLPIRRYLCNNCQSKVYR
jgi:uncharacterized protein YlaI